MFFFGAGQMIITPSGANPTPVNIGLAQEVTIDESVELKAQYGQGNYPVSIGAGTVKTSGKAKAARISGLALAAAYYGVTPTVGQTAFMPSEAWAVPASTPWQVMAANSATFTQDQGVVYAATGVPLKRVASAPAIGQYSVTAGVYTFADADASKALLGAYNYTIASTGQTIAINSRLIGPTVNFSLNLFGQDPNGVALNLQLYNCVTAKFGFATKLTDFVSPEFEFQYFQNAAGAVGQWSFGDSM